MRRCGRDLCRIDECGTEPYSKHRKGAAFATAAATVGATRGSRGLAMMLVSLSSKSGMRDAMAPVVYPFLRGVRLFDFDSRIERLCHHFYAVNGMAERTVGIAKRDAVNTVILYAFCMLKSRMVIDLRNA